MWRTIRGDTPVDTTDNEPMVNILSIEAWADGADNWTWNDWHKVGTAPLSTCDLEPAALIQFMIDDGYLRDGVADKVDLEDDQYNLVIVDKETREPLFALEYGAVET